MNISLALILGIIPVILTSIRAGFLFFRKRRIPAANELMGDIFHFFLCACGIYDGFLVLYYGVYGEPYPGTELYIVLATLIVGGFVIIVMSVKSVTTRISQEPKI